ncbi:MAG TPA: DNA polymerase/3'-5' exonuclease PolX [Tepidisphaeraceae bacterium]|jgi:DNA polymerase (family 10)
MSLNAPLAKLFKTAAAVMEIKGEPVFKAIAFQRISRMLEDDVFDAQKSVDTAWAEPVAGVGKSSQKIIEAFVETGVSTDLDELIASVPAGLLDLMRIPSLGPKTISLLWRERGITGVGELAAAIDSGRLDGLKGIGAKKIESLKEGLAILATAGDRKGLVDALAIGQDMLDAVRKLPGVLRAEVGGSLRRWQETVGDIDLIATVKDVNPKDVSGAAASAAPKITEAFTKLPAVTKILGQGDTKASVLTTAGLQVDLRVVPDANFGATLQYFTGNKDHNKRLRGRAIDMGFTLNEWGLYDAKAYDKAEKETGHAPKLKPIASKNEADVYRALGLDYIPPELRQDRDEIERAAAGTLPNLITVEDIRGDLHTHTVASDGTGTIEEMAAAAKAAGYAYLGITDHSKSQVIAHGLSAADLIKHVAAIRKIGEKLKGIRLFAGCEVDILADGRLDYEDAVLAELDYVVASPHLALKQDSQKATDRLLRAIDNRYVTIVGHPTGRLIGGRTGLTPDFAKVFARAAAAGVAMEINAGWPRLDLSDLNARAALAAGVKLSINTDAHSPQDFVQLALGVAVARRAGAEADDVVNCLTGPEMVEFLERKR